MPRGLLFAKDALQTDYESMSYIFCICLFQRLSTKNLLGPAHRAADNRNHSTSQCESSTPRGSTKSSYPVRRPHRYGQRWLLSLVLNLLRDDPEVAEMRTRFDCIATGAYAKNIIFFSQNHSDYERGNYQGESRISPSAQTNIIRLPSIQRSKYWYCYYTTWRATATYGSSRWQSFI